MKLKFTQKDKLSNRGSWAAALLVGFCPVCIPSIGAFLASVGLGFIVNDAILKPMLILFLGVAWLGLIWSYLKKHRNLGPLLLGLLMGVTLYVGRYVPVPGAITNSVLMYGGIAGVLSANFWNLRLSLRTPCSSCTSPREII